MLIIVIIIHFGAIEYISFKMLTGDCQASHSIGRKTEAQNKWIYYPGFHGAVEWADINSINSKFAMPASANSEPRT